MNNHKLAFVAIAAGLILILGACGRTEETEQAQAEPDLTRSSQEALPTPVPGIEPVGVQILNLANELREINPHDSLVLQFGDPISQLDVRPALTLFPMLEGSESWNAAGDTLTFTPSLGFAAGQFTRLT